MDALAFVAHDDEGGTVSLREVRLIEVFSSEEGTYADAVEGAQEGDAILEAVETDSSKRSHCSLYDLRSEGIRSAGSEVDVLYPKPIRCAYDRT